VLNPFKDGLNNYTNIEVIAPNNVRVTFDTGAVYTYHAVPPVILALCASGELDDRTDAVNRLKKMHADKTIQVTRNKPWVKPLKLLLVVLLMFVATSAVGQKFSIKVNQKCTIIDPDTPGTTDGGKTQCVDATGAVSVMTHYHSIEKGSFSDKDKGFVTLPNGQKMYNNHFYGWKDGQVVDLGPTGLRYIKEVSTDYSGAQRGHTNTVNNEDGTETVSVDLDMDCKAFKPWGDTSEAILIVIHVKGDFISHYADNESLENGGTQTGVLVGEYTGTKGSDIHEQHGAWIGERKTLASGYIVGEDNSRDHEAFKHGTFACELVNPH
jgi:hypothetical protein